MLQSKVPTTLLTCEPAYSDANPVQHHPFGGMVQGQQSVGRHAVYGKLDASDQAVASEEGEIQHR